MVTDTEKIVKIKELLNDLDIDVPHEEIENGVFTESTPKETAEFICDMMDYFKMIKEIVNFKD